MMCDVSRAQTSLNWIGLIGLIGLSNGGISAQKPWPLEVLWLLFRSHLAARSVYVQTSLVH